MLRGDRRELKQILERARARANTENIRRGREGNNEEIFSPIPLRGSVDRISIDDSILSPHRSISSPRRISLDSGYLGMPLLRRGTGRGSELLQLSQSSPANQDQTPQYFGSLLSDISNSGRLSSSFSPPNSPGHRCSCSKAGATRKWCWRRSVLPRSPAWSGPVNSWACWRVTTAGRRRPTFCELSACRSR